MSVDREKAVGDFILARLIEQQAQLRESVDALRDLLERIRRDGLPQSKPRTLNVKELAEMLSVKEGTVRNWISAKKIPFHRANGCVFFALDELMQWTAEQAKK